MNDELKNLQIYSEAQQASKANTSRKSQSHKAKEAWIKKGNKLALCVNDGCNRCVEVRSWSIGGKPSIKSECRSCSYARKSNKTLEGITFHKKNYCENVDGFLGFKCRWTTDINDPDPLCCFELDHLDGIVFPDRLDIITREDVLQQWKEVRAELDAAGLRN